MKKELCVKLVIYKNWTEMHCQQNIKEWMNIKKTDYATEDYCLEKKKNFYTLYVLIICNLFAQVY